MYNELKKFHDKIYTGMRVGQSHHWIYNDGNWNESKIAPNEWQISFNSIKNRFHAAPVNSGAKIGTMYHWYIIADQIATKLDANSYMTKLKGIKFKIGHKRPNWRNFSYQYPEQEGYKEQVIKVLENTLNKLKTKKTGLEKYII
jgi:hypothetical protein